MKPGLMTFVVLLCLIVFISAGGLLQPVSGWWQSSPAMKKEVVLGVLKVGIREQYDYEVTRMGKEGLKAGDLLVDEIVLADGTSLMKFDQVEIKIEGGLFKVHGKDIQKIKLGKVFELLPKHECGCNEPPPGKRVPPKPPKKPVHDLEKIARPQGATQRQTRPAAVPVRPRDQIRQP